MLAGAVLVAAALALTEARAQLFRRAVGAVGAGGAAGSVNLPYTVNDNQGNQWIWYGQYGQFQQQGNWPVYSQGAMLQINGAYPQIRNNQARIDDKTGELVFENLQVNNINITRRVLINKEEGYLRYVDILKNPQNAEANVNLVLSAHTNYGVQMANVLSDPKKKDQTIAWVAQTHANNRCVFEMFAGKGSKLTPNVNYAQGNNSVQANFNVKLAAGKEIALMHFHGTTNNLDSAQKFVNDMKESKVMATIPSAIRKLIVNFRGGENFIGEIEILRGDILDVVELRSGDQLKGTLKEKAFRLQSFYGAVDLPVDKVIAMISLGEFRPRHLVVTADGEIFGGKLERDVVALELSSGQLTEIPLSQITRVGYRKRAGEVDEWTFTKPMVLMRTGDRICLQMPLTDVAIATRYGVLQLKPQVIAAIDFQTEEHGVHDIYLTDGSKFAGLVTAAEFQMKLAGEGPEQNVKFPSSSIRRLQFSPPPEGSDDEQATLTLMNEDQLVGMLVGTLKLDTAFSTITINAGEVKRLVKTVGAPSDVQVTLWDETTVSGQLQEQELVCQTRAGVELRVPVALMVEYQQPRPLPSGAVVENIKKLVGELNADDWKQRDAAQEKLIAMGPVIIATLKEMRPGQTPEAQQRIDLILKQVEKDAKARPAAGARANPAAPGGAVDVAVPAPQIMLNKW